MDMDTTRFFPHKHHMLQPGGRWRRKAGLRTPARRKKISKHIRSQREAYAEYYKELSAGFRLMEEVVEHKTTPLPDTLPDDEAMTLLDAFLSYEQWQDDGTYKTGPENIDDWLE